MTVSLNGNTITLTNDYSLFQLLESKYLSEKKGIAVAVNNSVVKKENWTNHDLKEGDQILVIGATKGG